MRKKGEGSPKTFDAMPFFRGFWGRINSPFRKGKGLNVRENYAVGDD